ncbi:MAG: hypothetical protein WCR52_20125 [Bacteroidota bacterium]
MQKQFLNLLSLAVIALSLSLLASCEKDAGKLPNIAFKTGTNYTSADKTVAKGTTITIGINASKAEDKDVLKSFDASRSVNGAAGVSFFNETTTSANQDNYSKDLDITVGSTAGTEKYTFTVVNRDGLTNSVSLTLTVQ